MRKLAAILGIVFSGWSAAYSAGAPQMQDIGSVRISTSVGISVSTTPSILLSTGFNMPLESLTGGNTFNSSTRTINGQFLLGRIGLEVVNYSTIPVWIGYSAAVTSFPSVSMGRRIDASTTSSQGVNTTYSFKSADSIWNYWIKSGDMITDRSVLVIQTK